ncbi:bifunctional folylpolyglutamate synthase/dihydrofolate synthase [Litorimonas cladophorae]|uniref:Dihydrofolate synthase/folylpolyglutamate synthase n=1 Tax=Litorimonas cladophorae TaxID=1220491 RepID=A0A918NIC7_9PROT|nr:folylpolyglutamate synthase/dihydrofolate synthase family protein [Litorimonas cladophorae]GGX72541.1 bifunctional folylpolyglutamate synthase/dihydrofolate synthase [Litorimonas cladophorae]
MASLDQVLAQLTALHPKKIDLGLERIERVLKALGNPHLRLPPAIHIAGTNGKGSTTAFLRAMVEAEGKTAHVYTSPHLVRFNERITLASKEISNSTLLNVLERVMEANAGQPLSFFEATTAAAFLAFSETHADYALIEVGLGGRYDATNVFDPIASVITPINYDHAEFLGRDLAKIAREKAGIVKDNVPVFAGRQEDLVSAVLRNEAAKHRAPIQFLTEDFRAYREQDRMVFDADDVLMDLPKPALIGSHQIDNAGVAIATARAIGISDEAIGKGLSKVIWPARLQSLTTGLYADMVADSNGELWLDGGHNPHAAAALADAMAELQDRSERVLILIMGILGNKDAGKFLDKFTGLASSVIAVDIPGSPALAPETIKELAENRGMIGQVAENLTDAVQRAINTGEALSREAVSDTITPPRILICGSLYLAGQVLSA